MGRSMLFSFDENLNGQDVVTGENKPQVFEIPDAIDNKEPVHSFASDNKNCYSSMDVKKFTIDILKHIRQNPLELDMLIDDIQTEIDAESRLSWLKANLQPDLMKLQFQRILSKYGNYGSYPQCSGAFLQLAETAMNSLSELQNFPLCLQLIFGYQGPTVQQMPNEENIDLNVIISKQMDKYKQYTPESRSQHAELEIPEINGQNKHVELPIMMQPLQEPRAGVQGVFIQPQETRDKYVPEYPSIQAITPQLEYETRNLNMPQDNDMPQDAAPQEGPTLPEYISQAQPEYPRPEHSQPESRQSEHPQPIIEPKSQLVVIPENLQQEPELVYVQPEVYPRPEMYEPQPEAYSETYVEPNKQLYIQPNREPFYVKSLSDYVEPKSIYIEHKPIYVEPKPVYVEPKPIYIEHKPIYSEPTHGVYSEIVHPPQHEEMLLSTLSGSKIVNILLQLITDKPSLGNIENIFAILNKYRPVFKPRLYKILSALLNGFRKGSLNAYQFNEMFSFLLKPQNDKLWNNEKRQLLWHLLLPDKEGQVDITKLNIILSLIQAKEPSSLHILDDILPFYQSIKEGLADQRTIEIVLTLLDQNTKSILRPDQKNILLTLIKPNKKGLILQKYLDIAAPLVHWDQITYLNPEYVNTIFTLLRSHMKGNIDSSATDIIYEILSPKKTNFLTKKEINIIFNFLKPDNGRIEPKRLELVLFILKNMTRAPQLNDVLIKLLNDSEIIHSKYIDILLSLQKRRLLNIQLLESLVTLLKQEKIGNVDQHALDNVLLLLEPYKTSHPKIVIDIYNQLRPAPTSSNFNFNINSVPKDLKVLLYNLIHSGILYKGDDGKPDIDLMPLVSQGYISQKDQQSLKVNLLAKILQMLQWQQRKELATETLANNYGFIELTYMLKHQKPLLYHPVYYVKYKIPMVRFLTSVKSLIAQKPQLSSDPTRLLQELILEGNVSEISPNLKGYRKEDLLKLTFNDGDLVQAKVLDEKSLNLNEQIKLIHNLNADVSPKDILHQNQMNAIKYYSAGNLFNIGNIPNIGSLPNNADLQNIGDLHYIRGQLNVSPMTNMDNMEETNGANMPSATLGASGNYGSVDNYGGFGIDESILNDDDDSVGYSPKYYKKGKEYDDTISMLRSSNKATTDSTELVS